MSRFLVLRVNKDPSDTYAVPYHGDEGEAVFSALDTALPDEGSKIEYAVVDARDAGSARYAPHARDWETVPSRWVRGWQHDFPDVLQGPPRKRETKQPADKLSIEQLAKMFGLPEWDRIDEMNQQYYWESARGAETEEAQMEAEQAAQTEVYNRWYDAVESTAEKLFEKHGLGLLAMKHTRKVHANYRPYLLKVIPTRSWSDAADHIRETINGVGYFHFYSLNEFLNSGPYTPRQAVLAHLDYVARYPDVYGTTSAQSLYQHAW